jgi:hypothetical protein
MGEAARIGSFSQSYAMRNFSGITIGDNKIRGVARYDEEVFGYTETDEQYNLLGSMGGLPNVIDMSTELVASTAILNIRPVEPQDALKVYVEIAMEGAVNKFLGVQGRTHEQVLARLKGKYNFTEAEITSAIRTTIAAEVDKQFKNTQLPPGEIQAIKDILVAFFVRPNTGTFNATRDVSFIYTMSVMTLSGEKKRAYGAVAEAYDNTLRLLSSGLADAVYNDVVEGDFNVKSGTDNIVILASTVTEK